MYLIAKKGWKKATFISEHRYSTQIYGLLNKF